MNPFSVHRGIVAPLRRTNVDTDQIIPAVYLKRVTRTGFEDGLFAAWRNDPAFVLNNDAYDGGSVLVAGPDFGTGSSREHAVWALQDYGFRAVVSSRFADIFRTNCTKAGLLPVEVDHATCRILLDAVATDPSIEISVDVEERHLEAPRASVDCRFALDDFTQWRFLEGLDDIALTLRQEERVTAYEAQRASWLPTTT